MRRAVLTYALIFCAVFAGAQTADELVAKNLAAKGGIEKIKAIKSFRMKAQLQEGGFKAQVGEDAAAPNKLRQTVTIQGMSQIEAYDGSTGWQISPFEGRKDPELLGDDEMRSLVEDADFYGPLVDYQAKGNRIEYLGHDMVDGDDALRLKVTLKNGDIFDYYLDPDTYLEIRIDRQHFIRGSVREVEEDMGSYKQVAGVYFPFSMESGPKRNPNARTKINIESMEANVALDDAEFKMPAAPATAAPQQHQEPPVKQKAAPKPPEPAKPPKDSF